MSRLRHTEADPGLLFMGRVGEAGSLDELEAYLALGIRSFVLPPDLLAAPDSLSALVRSLRSIARARGIDRLTIALEGGRLGNVPYLPSPLSLAALAPGKAAAAAKRSGQWLGRILKAAGLDLYFGPFLDLASDPKRQEGVLELFGEDPRSVGRLGKAFVRGLHTAGIPAAPGDFPGCGALYPGAASGLALLPFPVQHLEAAELRAFAPALRHEAAAVRVGRVLAPALEPSELPAARSVRVIEGRLRTELGFRGVVVAGDLDRDPEGAGRAAVLGALAGADAAIAGSPETAAEAVDALRKALVSGELPLPRALVSLDRLSAFDARTQGSRAAEAEEAARISGSEALLGFTEAVTAEALSIFKPSKPSAGAVESVLVFHPRSISAAALEAALEAVKIEVPRARIHALPESLSTAELAEAGRLVEGLQGIAAVLSYNAHRSPSQEGLIHVLEERKPALSLIATGNPYDAAFFPRASLRGAVYGFNPISLRTAMRFLAGKIPAAGRCPVGVMGLEV